MCKDWVLVTAVEPHASKCFSKNSTLADFTDIKGFFLWFHQSRNFA